MTDFRERARAVIQQVGKAPPELIRGELADTYPAITLEEAKRVRDTMVAMLTASTAKEQKRLEKEYNALHAGLKKKYRKSGT